jgi:rubredoxin
MPMFVIPVTYDYSERKPDPKPIIQVAQLLHGPFESKEECAKHASEILEKGQKYLVLLAALEVTQPRAKEKPESEKRAPGNEANWNKTEHGWACKTCGHIIMEAKVAHPIHISPGAGFGECRYESVGYCPNCERKPDFHGNPVHEDGRPW